MAVRRGGAAHREPLVGGAGRVAPDACRLAALSLVELDRARLTRGRRAAVLVILANVAGGAGTLGARRRVRACKARRALCRRVGVEVRRARGAEVLGAGAESADRHKRPGRTRVADRGGVGVVVGLSRDAVLRGAEVCVSDE